MVFFRYYIMELDMDVYSVLNWGSPLGLALFFFFSCSGAGILFWGISHLIKSNKGDD